MGVVTVDEGVLLLCNILDVWKSNLVSCTILMYISSCEACSCPISLFVHLLSTWDLQPRMKCDAGLYLRVIPDYTLCSWMV